MRLSDGGLYDNLGLEPVWKSRAVLLASDGGAAFDFAVDRGLTPPDPHRQRAPRGALARAAS